ncbi:hypothetical protein OHC33_006608 [Knufia fluminis]|uniref:Uncharacterized protein n=1 Tax=Knufia fluminis TaxID=191047 RepID=A0AAN8I3E3_9EURO|nr:hypothetical protein OHC33_006608 [Knufia fluminis]
MFLSDNQVSLDELRNTTTTKIWDTKPTGLAQETSEILDGKITTAIAFNRFNLTYVEGQRKAKEAQLETPTAAQGLVLGLEDLMHTLGKNNYGGYMYEPLRKHMPYWAPEGTDVLHEVMADWLLKDQGTNAIQGAAQPAFKRLNELYKGGFFHGRKSTLQTIRQGLNNTCKGGFCILRKRLLEAFEQEDGGKDMEDHAIMAKRIVLDVGKLYQAECEAEKAAKKDEGSRKRKAKDEDEDEDPGDDEFEIEEEVEVKEEAKVKADGEERRSKS